MIYLINFPSNRACQAIACRASCNEIWGAPILAEGQDGHGAKFEYFTVVRGDRCKPSRAPTA